VVSVRGHTVTGLTGWKWPARRTVFDSSRFHRHTPVSGAMNAATSGRGTGTGRVSAAGSVATPATRM
ncbi:MAG: hypothetical protein PXX82_04375, partial [Methanomassiliicoccales archaeon]|nr:hypothetical protein [Methanomassiliicoccales archaeon]